MKNKSISSQSIFGEYKKTEDRVTAALLQVIQAGGQMVVERLFGDHFDIPSNEINVIPQSYQKQSNPDGEISCDSKYNIFIESKIVPGAINEKQLIKHMELTNPAQCRYLIYLTPDIEKPMLLQHFMVEWMDWETILGKLAEIVAEGLASELLEYLIKQFSIFVKHLVYDKMESRHYFGDNCFDDSDYGEFDNYGKDKRVIIVGGRWGEDVALNYGFYACQPYRYFRPASYMAFYHQNRIKYLFEIIGDPVQTVDLRAIPDISGTDYFTVKESHYAGDLRKYFKLEIVQTFNPEIVNNKLSKNGKSCAFIQGQTYTTYDRIMKATKTSDL